MRKIIALIFCCFALSSFAQQQKNNSNQKVIAHIKNNMVASYLEYAKQYSLCIEQEKNILPATPFKSLELSNQQLYDVLRYFSLVHFNLCMGDTSSELVKYMSAGRSFNVEQVNEHDDPKFKLLSDSTRSWVDEIEFEAKYLQLPETVRQQIEQITSLHAPFDMVKSYTAITGIGSN